MTAAEGYRPSRPEHPHVSDSIWKMVEECCSDPPQRMTITEVVAVLEAELDNQ
jgi:hypothetical protein